MTRSHHPSTFALLLALATAAGAFAAVSGCAGDAASAYDGGGGGICPDDDCACDDSCGGGNDAPVTVALRVIPPAESGLMEQHVADLTVRPGDSLPSVVLPTLARVTGTVYYGAVENRVEARATLTFRNLDGLSGLPILRSVTTGADLDGQSPGEFSVRLAPARYAVTIDPEDPAFPSLRVGELEVDGDLRFDPQLPSPETHFIVTGSVVRYRPGEGGAADAVAPVPLRGARVTLTSTVTGQSLSTEGITAEGRFSVRLAPVPGEYGIRITPTSDGEPLPDIVLPPLYISETMDVGELVAGTWADPVEVVGSVLGVNGEQMPVEGATVFFVQSVEHGTFSQVALSSIGGMFTSSVLPGAYQVTLVPPANLHYAAATFRETIEGVRTQSFFELTEKPSLLGTVVSPSLQPVGGATVVAEPIGFEVSTLSLGSVSTVTEASGLYLVEVHPGVQRVLINPPASSGLAPLVLTGEVVEADHRRDVQLAPARRATGGVYDDGPSAIAGATVEVYLQVGGDLVLVDTVTSGENGEYEIDLPVVR
jgi:hypothetical protein